MIIRESCLVDTAPLCYYTGNDLWKRYAQSIEWEVKDW